MPNGTVPTASDGGDDKEGGADWVVGLVCAVVVFGCLLVFLYRTCVYKRGAGTHIATSRKPGRGVLKVNGRPVVSMR